MLTGSTIARKVQKPFLEFDKRQNTKESAELSVTPGVQELLRTKQGHEQTITETAIVVILSEA